MKYVQQVRGWLGQWMPLIVKAGICCLFTDKPVNHKQLPALIYDCHANDFDIV